MSREYTGTLPKVPSPVLSEEDLRLIEHFVLSRRELEIQLNPAAMGGLVKPKCFVLPKGAGIEVSAKPFGYRVPVENLPISIETCLLRVAAVTPWRYKRNRDKAPVPPCNTCLGHGFMTGRGCFSCGKVAKDEA